MFVSVPLREVSVKRGSPLRPGVDGELVNGHPPEVTFQGGYYVAQSLTRQWQDPRLVGMEPLLSQGRPKSRRLQPGRALMGSPGPLTACSGLTASSGAVRRKAWMRASPSAPQEGGGGLARMWRKSAHPH